MLGSVVVDIDKDLQKSLSERLQNQTLKTVTKMKNHFQTLRNLCCLSCLLIGLTIGSGCSVQQTYPGVNQYPSTAQPQNLSINYTRVEIDQTELAQALRSALQQMAQNNGSFDPEPIINDYLVLIRQGLYYNGFCRVNRLTVNNISVDIETYFRADQNPASLHVDIYTNGQYQPNFSVVNHYMTAAM